MKSKLAVSFILVILVTLFAALGFGQAKMSAALSRPVSSAVEIGLSETIEREISGGTTMIFNVRLAAGQFVKVEAEQFGCDIMLVLNSPEKVNVFEFKDDNYQNGGEVQTAAVTVAGDYELKIVSFEDPEQKGRFKLRIAELRDATDREIRLTNGISIVNSLSKRVKVGAATSDQLRQVVSEYETALESFRFAGHRRFEAVVLSSMGTMLTRLGDLRGSIAVQEQALEIYRTLGVDEDLSVLLSNIATAYIRRNEPQKALELLYESAAVAERRDDDFNHSRALNLIGAVYEDLGEQSRALTYFTQALEKAEKIGQENFVVDATLNLGRAAYSAGDRGRAAELFQSAVTISRKIGNKRQTANALGNLGQVRFDDGQVANALQLLEESLAISRELGDKVAEGLVLRRFGKVHLVRGDLDLASATFARATEIFRGLEDSGNVAETLLLAARTDQRAGKVDSALEKTRDACDLIEQIRARVSSSELRDSFSANLQDYYELFVELLMTKHQQNPKGGFAAKAFEASERAKARGLLNLLTESNVEFTEGADKQLQNRENQVANLLAARLENLTRSLNGKTDAAQLEAIKTDIERLRRELDKIRTEIRGRNPRYAALTQPTPLSVAEMQRRILDEESVLLQYSLGEKRSFLFVLTKNEVETIELPGRERIEKAARLAHEALTARNRRVKFETAPEYRSRIDFSDADYLVHSADLSRMIIEPAAAFLKNRRLLVVADGALQYLPFAALRNGGKFLMETNEIVTLPSASVLGAIRSEFADKTPAPKTLAVFADPIFEKSDERLAGAKVDTKKNMLPGVLTRGDLELLRLPFTRREAQSVSALVAPDKRNLRLDADANRRSVLSPELSEYRYVHFATHGYVNSQLPELSGIVLSLFERDGRQQNGFLSLGDMYNLSLNAEMVVLSGCRTGLGREIHGEGLVGLTRGLLFAGARRVTVSLWDVNDEATSELMRRFYEQMLAGRKLTPAAALRQAQASLMRETKWSSPYYWASFVMQGEPK